MRLVIAVTALLAISGCTHLPNVKEEPLYYTMQATRLIDGCTTLGVSDDPSLIEKNPILGENPSDGEVVAHVIGGLALQHFVYEVFKRWNPRAGHWFAGLMTAGNTAVSANNFNKGATCP